MDKAILDYVKAIWTWLQSFGPKVNQQSIDIAALKAEFEKVGGTLLDETAAITRTLDAYGKLLQEIQDAIKQLQATGTPQPAVAFIAYLIDEQGNRMTEISQGVTMDQKVTDPGLNIELVPVDKFGNKGAALDGPVAWAGDTGFVVVDTSADPNGLKAKITYVGPIGDTIVTAKGDGDLGPGVTEITFSLPLHLMPGAASSFQANVTPVAPDAGGGTPGTP